ncbi:MAG: ankyrin repeat domain-containing protein [Bacteroidota bacterium]
MNQTQETFRSALKTGNLDTVKEIGTQYPQMVQEPDDRGFYPLVLAAYYDQVDIVTVLLQLGADPEAKDGSGNTALMGASFKGFVSTIETLLQHGAAIDAQNNEGASALAFAAMFDQEAVAKLLLEKGADPLLKDQKGNTPYDQARLKGLRWAKPVFEAFMG